MLSPTEQSCSEHKPNVNHSAPSPAIVIFKILFNINQKNKKKNRSGQISADQKENNQQCCHQFSFPVFWNTAQCRIWAFESMRFELIWASQHSKLAFGGRVAFCPNSPVTKSDRVLPIIWQINKVWFFFFFLQFTGRSPTHMCIRPSSPCTSVDPEDWHRQDLRNPKA